MSDHFGTLYIKVLPLRNEVWIQSLIVIQKLKNILSHWIYIKSYNITFRKIILHLNPSYVARTHIASCEILLCPMNPFCNESYCFMWNNAASDVSILHRRNSYSILWNNSTSYESIIHLLNSYCVL